MSKRNPKTPRDKQGRAPVVTTVSAPSFQWEGIWQPIVVALLAFALYAPSLQYGYVLDDDLVCAKNSQVQEGRIGDIFTSSYYEAFTGKVDRNYRPMSLAAFALEKRLFDADAHTFHLFNLLWYSLACLMTYLLSRRLFREVHWWLPFSISLLFLAHPIHTEVVANIKSRDEIFVFFGMVACLYALMKYWEGEKTGWLLGSLSAYLFAALSKENGLPIVGLIPLTLYFFGGITDWKRIGRTSAFFLIPIAVYFAMQQSFTAPNENTLGVIDNILYTEGIPKSAKIATAVGMMGHYLYLLFSQTT